MRTILTTTALVLMLSACDGEGPADPGTTSAATVSPLCVFEPSKLTQEVQITRAISAQAGSSCAAVASGLVADGHYGIKAGTLIDAPIKLTSVKSYDGASLGLSCVYDIVGYAEPVDPSVPCTLTAWFATRVEVPLP